MKLEQVEEECGRLLNQVAKCFKPGIKLTLLARKPDNDEADFLLTSDELPEAIKALERRRDAEGN